MKTLKFLAIILPMCVALVACDGKKSEPTNSAETAFVTAQDLCKYLPYTSDNAPLKFATGPFNYQWKIKEVVVDTADNVGNVKVVFDVNLQGEADYAAKVEASAQTLDNKKLELTYKYQESTFSPYVGNYSLVLTSSKDLPSEILFDDGDTEDPSYLATIQLNKGFIEFADPEMEMHFKLK